MDCRQFRKQHAYFIDDMLSGVATWALRDHLHTCGSCSRFDTHLRRSLLLARQTRTLEPSRDFQRKLSARLAAEKLARPAFRDVMPTPRTRRVPLIAAAAAALAIAVAGLGVFTSPAAKPFIFASEVASAPLATVDARLRESPLAPPVPAQPVHPALLLAQRATEQFAALQARAASTRATH